LPAPKLKGKAKVKSIGSMEDLAEFTCDAADFFAVKEATIIAAPVKISTSRNASPELE